MAWPWSLLAQGQTSLRVQLLQLGTLPLGSPAALTPGKHTVVFDFTYAGPGIGKGGTGVLKVDGKEVVSHKIPHTIPFLTVGDETFDIGADTRTPVDDKDYQVPFRFNGKIDSLTFKLGPIQLTEKDQMKLRKAAAIAKD